MLASLSVNTLNCLHLLLLLSPNCAYLVTSTLPLRPDRKLSVLSAHNKLVKQGPLYSHHCLHRGFQQKRFCKKKKTFASPLVEIRDGNLGCQIDCIWNQQKPRQLDTPGGIFLIRSFVAGRPTLNLSHAFCLLVIAHILKRGTGKKVAFGLPASPLDG